MLIQACRSQHLLGKNWEPYNLRQPWVLELFRMPATFFYCSEKAVQPGGWLCSRGTFTVGSRPKCNHRDLCLCVRWSFRFLGAYDPGWSTQRFCEEEHRKSGCGAAWFDERGGGPVGWLRVPACSAALLDVMLLIRGTVPCHTRSRTRYNCGILKSCLSVPPWLRQPRT